MPQTNTQTLKRLVERSWLLTPDRKEELLKRLSSLSPDQQEKLRKILDGEDEVLTTVADRTLAEALGRGNVDVLKRLDNFFVKARKKLHKAEEGVERTGEAEQCDQLLDDINT